LGQAFEHGVFDQLGQAFEHGVFEEPQGGWVARPNNAAEGNERTANIGGVSAPASAQQRGLVAARRLAGEDDTKLYQILAMDQMAQNWELAIDYKASEQKLPQKLSLGLLWSLPAFQKRVITSFALQPSSNGKGVEAWNDEFTEAETLSQSEASHVVVFASFFTFLQFLLSFQSTKSQVFYSTGREGKEGHRRGPPKGVIELLWK
jgi:hypothetical protein